MGLAQAWKDRRVSYNDDIVQETLREFASFQTYRAQFAQHWEEVAELILPTYRNTFFAGSYNFPGQKKTERQVDATAMLALGRFAAICDSLLSPRSTIYEVLQGDTAYLKKDRETRLWMEEATRILFQERYRTTANFQGQNLSIYQSLGAFGNGMLWIDDYIDDFSGTQGIRYSARPLGEVYFGENFQGQVDRFIRFFRMTAPQAHQMARVHHWELPDKIKECRDPNALFQFLHRVCPRTDFDPQRLDFRGKPYASYYVVIDGQQLLSEGGYRTFPAAITRYEQAPGEQYGRGPAMLILPAAKTLNAEKTDFLVQGHRANSPTLVTTDDGLIDFQFRPGAVNKGGMSPEGKMLIGAVPFGQLQVTKEMMDVEGGLINDAFLVSLFQILVESPQMTATEVVERINEKGILLAPTVGRQHGEYIGPMTHRELDILSSQRKLPPMPPLLREANAFGHGYDILYTSPLAKMQRAQEVAGFGRTLETALTIVNTTGDPAPLDKFNFDVIIPDIADIQAVPEHWMNSDDDVAKIREQRQKDKEAMMQTQAMPAAAAMVKAGAVAKQAGLDPSSIGLKPAQ